MRRLALIVCVLGLAVAAPVAAAQTGEGGSGAFGPLPQAAPEETPTPTPPPSVEAQQQTDRTLLYLIGAGLLVLFVVIGYVITRDARSALPEDATERARAARPGPAPPRAAGEGQGAGQDEGPAPRAAPESLKLSRRARVLGVIRISPCGDFPGLSKESRCAA